MTRTAVVSSLVAVLLFTPGTSRASASLIDLTEHIFGATNVNAVAGHGGLTVGVSSEGDLTMISWPGPTFANQLLYLSSNDLDARSEPHFGATDGMGSFLGLLVTSPKGTSLVWLRGAQFTHAQKYAQGDAPIVETTFDATPGSGLGLTVTVIDIVDPAVDVLTRRVVVTKAPSSPVSAAELVVYENLSPTLSRIPMAPVADWLLGWANDFLAVYDRSARAVIHVHPSDRGLVTGLFGLGEDPTTVDYGPVDAVMRGTPTDAQVDGLIAQLDTAFPPGVAALVTTEPPPSSFQVGADATPFCARAGTLAKNIQALPAVFHDPGLDYITALASTAMCTDSLPRVRAARGWTWSPTDALTDATAGAFEGSRIAACQANAVLAAPLAFSGLTAEGTAVIAFGKSVKDARAALRQGTQTSAAARQAAAEKAAHDALAGAALPAASLGKQTALVAQRALVNLYVARDRTSGAAVASVNHQPPYYLDWPRDGSFFMHAMDVAGLFPWATARAEWYTTTQRQDLVALSPISGVAPTDPVTGKTGFPAYAWEMNYYADGTIGGNIRFEIDNTALHLWAVVVHAGALAEADRKPFVAKVWPTFRNALELLIRWCHTKDHLPAPANEDDQLSLTSTLHGATAVYAALVAGARLASYAGDSSTATSALSQSEAVQNAILARYYNAKTGLFDDDSGDAAANNAGSTSRGDTAWLAWPARVLDPNDPRQEKQLAHDMASALADIRGETEGAAYVMKTVVAAALLGKDGGSRDMARTAVPLLADTATADTLHFGEVFLTLPPAHPGGPKVFSQRVATPHVWEGMLFYLSAMALSAPDRFDPEIGALPLPPAVATAPPPPAPAPASSGCGCRVGANELAAPPGLSTWAAAWLAALAVRRRRPGRHSARPARP